MKCSKKNYACYFNGGLKVYAKNKKNFYILSTNKKRKEKLDISENRINQYAQPSVMSPKTSVDKGRPLRKVMFCIILKN